MILLILYTSMPIELVIEGMDKKYEFKEIEIEAVKLIIEPISVNQGKIVKLISTDPQDYLNPNLSPGKIITFALNK
ncbi:MAG TPA: YlzJ-like family protein [Tepidanaerobacteraceae bacterium]|nr:YlzJ-like family protein [Tepidanaerobacteraceae bacterium]